MISVIVPAYNEEENLPELLERLVSVAATLPSRVFEFIFVDDGSIDGTRDVLDGLRHRDSRVEVIRLARNCGSHAAAAAGLSHCRGDAAILLAADLQDPPEIIPGLLDEHGKGHRIVWAIRERRDGERWITRVVSRAYYALMNRLTNVRQPPSGADVFLIDREAIEAFKRAPEKNSSIFMLIAWLGFSQGQISYVKERRLAGESKWSFFKRLKLLFDSIMSFSYAPLRLMSLAGALSALIGFLYGGFIAINAIAGRVSVEGWSALMVVVLLLSGFQMIMLGILGEYLWRTYDEARGRPRYVIEKNTIAEEYRTGAQIEREGEAGHGQVWTA